MFGVGNTPNGCPHNFFHDKRAVLAFRRVFPGLLDAVDFVLRPMVRAMMKVPLNRRDVCAVTIGRDLNALGNHARGEIANEGVRIILEALAEMPGRNELRISVDGNPSPEIAHAIRAAQLLREIPLFRVTVAPDFLELKPLALEAAHGLVQIRLAGVAHVGQEPEDGFLVDPDHAARPTNRVSLDERREGLNAEGRREAIHSPIMRERSRSVKKKEATKLFVPEQGVLQTARKTTAMPTILQPGDDPLALWASEIPESTEIGLARLAQAACRRAFSRQREEYPLYTLGELIVPVGWDRFVQLQHKMKEFGQGDPVLKPRVLRHSNGLPYTQLYTQRLVITSVTLVSIGAYQESLFRMEQQAQQGDYFKGISPLICHLVLSGFEDLSDARFVRVQFPDGDDGYLEPYVDLKGKLVKPTILPVENVGGNIETPPHEDIAKDRDDDDA